MRDPLAHIVPFARARLAAQPTRPEPDVPDDAPSSNGHDVPTATRRRRAGPDAAKARADSSSVGNKTLSIRTSTWSSIVHATSAAPLLQIVAGLIAAGDIVLLYGFAGVGKSVITIMLALAIARGEPVFGQLPTTKSRVAVLDGESHAPRLGTRLAAISAANGIDVDDDALPGFALVTSARFDTDAGLDQIFDWVCENVIDVVFVDTLRRVHRLRENEADDMALLASAVKALQQRVRDELGRVLTVVLVHHSPKPREMASNAGETMARGSGDLIANVDVGLYLRRGRERGQVVIEQSKARWSEPMAPMLVRIEGDAERLTVIYAGTIEEISGQLDRAVEVSLAALAQGPLTRRQLLERGAAANLTARTTERALTGLTRDGKVIKGRSGREVQYALTDSGLLS